MTGTVARGAKYPPETDDDAAEDLEKMLLSVADCAERVR